MKKVILKAGKEHSLKNRHPWIFSGAIETFPDCSPGDLFPVYSSTGEFLAQAYFHPENSIAGRVLSFDQNPIEEVLQQRFFQAITLRNQLIDRTETNAYRLINAEGDGIPGLIVDNYNGHLCIQIHTSGIEKLKNTILDILIKMVNPKSIYEKSISPGRLQDGLDEREGTIFGPDIEQVTILENGLKFLVSPKLGQKTGFFIDQREMRQKIRDISKGRRVLNLFSYTGGFAIYALKGGARGVVSVDQSAQACSFAEQNTTLNDLAHHNHPVLCQDAFHFLETEPLADFDLVIIDPPAFTKTRKNVDAAVRGYRQLNEMALAKLGPQTLLLTCSCSNHIDDALFRKTIAQAALNAGRSVRVLSHHIHAPDHPVSLYHPEGGYLKSLLLFVD